MLYSHYILHIFRLQVTLHLCFIDKCLKSTNRVAPVILLYVKHNDNKAFYSVLLVDSTHMT